MVTALQYFSSGIAAIAVDMFSWGVNRRLIVFRFFVQFHGKKLWFPLICARFSLAKCRARSPLRSEPRAEARLRVAMEKLQAAVWSLAGAEGVLGGLSHYDLVVHGDTT